jgi:hypothetical protein
MTNPFFVGIVSWFLPGFGHLMLGRWNRGIIIAAVVWSMFVIAVLSGGAYYPGFDFKDGSLLYLLNVFARLGNGLGTVVTTLFFATPLPNVAAWSTFEYGGRFLEIAGLLNYLAVLDAFDIQLGRKK